MGNRLETGLTNVADFSKFRRNSADSDRFKLKIRWILEFKFKYFKKNWKIYVKKLDQILRTLVKNFFSKSRLFCWIKFKMNQKCQNGPTWPTTHVYGISSLSLSLRTPWLASTLKLYWSQWHHTKIARADGETGRIAPKIGRLGRLVDPGMIAGGPARRWPDFIGKSLINR
jgi:hypothetical protein